jgi:hypothetical protein
VGVQRVSGAVGEATMTSTRIHHHADALVTIAGHEHVETARKLMAIARALHADADAVAAIETHVVPASARAGLSVVTDGDVA